MRHLDLSAERAPAANPPWNRGWRLRATAGPRRALGATPGARRRTLRRAGRACPPAPGGRVPRPGAGTPGRRDILLRRVRGRTPPVRGRRDHGVLRRPGGGEWPAPHRPGAGRLDRPRDPGGRPRAILDPAGGAEGRLRLGRPHRLAMPCPSRPDPPGLSGFGERHLAGRVPGGVAALHPAGCAASGAAIGVAAPCGASSEPPAVRGGAAPDGRVADGASRGASIAEGRAADLDRVFAPHASGSPGPALRAAVPPARGAPRMTGRGSEDRARASNRTGGVMRAGRAPARLRVRVDRAPGLGAPADPAAGGTCDPSLAQPATRERSRPERPPDGPEDRPVRTNAPADVGGPGGKGGLAIDVHVSARPLSGARCRMAKPRNATRPRAVAPELPGGRARPGGHRVAVRDLPAARVAARTTRTEAAGQVHGGGRRRRMVAVDGGAGAALHRGANDYAPHRPPGALPRCPE